jgi:hypothetical protein
MIDRIDPMDGVGSPVFRGFSVSELPSVTNMHLIRSTDLSVFANIINAFLQLMSYHSFAIVPKSIDLPWRPHW